MQRRGFLSLSIMMVVLLVFLPVCGFDFISYDDNVNVYNNDTVLRFSFGNLLYFWKYVHNGLYIPLTYNLWMVLAKASTIFSSTSSGLLNPALFHLANLLFHALSTLIVFRILRLTVVDKWGAVAGALLFGLHPVQVEAVAWVTGLKDVLSGFFALLAFHQYLRFSQATEPDYKQALWRRYLPATLFFLCALLAKPGAVVLPLLVGLYGYLFFSRNLKWTVSEMLVWVALALPVIVVTKLSQPPQQAGFVPELWQRFLIAGDSITFYLGKLILPIGLGPDYGRTPQYVLDHGWVYLSGLMPYLLAAVLLWKFRKPWLLFVAGTFLVVILPVSGIIPFSFQATSTVADRYLYLAMLAPAYGLAYLLAQYRQKQLKIGAGVVLVLLATLTIMTLPNWRNSLNFHSYTLRANPRSWMAYNILASTEFEAAHYREATAAGRKAVAANPANRSANYNLGISLARLGQSQEAAAYLRKALAIDPTFSPTYAELGNLLLEMDLPAQAAEVIKQGTKFFFDNRAEGGSTGLEHVKNARGQAIIYSISGRLNLMQNRIDQAAADFQHAIAADPDFLEAYSNLGNVYFAANRYNDAIAAYQRAIAVWPENADAYNNLCLVHSILNQTEEALSNCRMALQLRPNFADPYLNIGNIMMNRNQPQQAISAFHKALEADPGYDLAAESLAVAYQATGNTQEAAKYYQLTQQIRAGY